MKTNEDPASMANRPPKVQPESSAQARKVGSAQTWVQLRTIAAGRVASGSRLGTVSSKLKATKASVTALNTASASSVACQPKASTTRPPTMGESTAMMPSPVSAFDMRRAPVCGSCRSRTMERAQVTAAAIAAPCRARQATSAAMLWLAAPARLAAV